MKNEMFQKYVESTRDCDAMLLDIAIKKGLHLAKSNAFDYKKLFNLAAACAATIALCFAANIEPVRMAVAGFMEGSSLMTESGSEALPGYMMSIAKIILHYLGGT